MGQLILQDIHDGDQKKITIVGKTLLIQPHNNDQSWKVLVGLTHTRRTVYPRTFRMAVRDGIFAKPSGTQSWSASHFPQAVQSIYKEKESLTNTIPRRQYWMKTRVRRSWISTLQGNPIHHRASSL